MPSEDSKHVKKEDGNNNIHSSGSKKVTTSNVKPPSKVAGKVKKEEPLNDSSPRPVKASAAASASRSKVKKEDYSDDDFDDDIPLGKRASNNAKEVVKKKKIIKEEEPKKKKKGEVATAASDSTLQKKREKKVYDLPGQKRDPPEEKDPLRIFYESLYKQIPTSEMSQVWLMESGLLSKEIAMKYLKRSKRKVCSRRSILQPKQYQRQRAALGLLQSRRVAQPPLNLLLKRRPQTLHRSRAPQQSSPRSGKLRMQALRKILMTTLFYPRGEKSLKCFPG